MAKRGKKIISRAKARALNETVYGKEPVFGADHELNRVEYMKALNWYAQALSREDSKDYLATFLKEQNRLDDLRALKKVPDAFVTTTYGAIARLLTKGVKIPESGPSWLNSRLKELLEKYAYAESEANTSTVSVQDRVDTKARQIAGKIDNFFEDNVWFDTKKAVYNDAILKILNSESVSGVVAEKIATLLTPHLEELKSINKEPDLQEAYAKYTKADIKRFVGFYQNVVDTCQNFNVNVKKVTVRKPRAKKAVSAEKKVGAFKYLKMFSLYQMASVNPAKVISAQQVWIYNTKYRDLTVLNALDRGGIDIKGQSFVNFDEKTSEMKKLSAKMAEKIVKAISSSGKRASGNAMKEVEGNSKKPQTRCGNDTIILGVN